MTLDGVDFTVVQVECCETKHNPDDDEDKDSDNVALVRHHRRQRLATQHAKRHRFGVQHWILRDIQPNAVRLERRRRRRRVLCRMYRLTNGLPKQTQTATNHQTSRHTFSSSCSPSTSGSGSTGATTAFLRLRRRSPLLLSACCCSLFVLMLRSCVGLVGGFFSNSLDGRRKFERARRNFFSAHFLVHLRECCSCVSVDQI